MSSKSLLEYQSRDMRAALVSQEAEWGLAVQIADSH